mgnify:CR=1 FL=1
MSGARERLQEALARDAAAGQLVGSETRRVVNRAYYADFIGVSRSLLSHYRDLLDEVESQYRGSYRADPNRIPPGVDNENAQRLQEILEADVKSGTLVPGRNGRLNRKHYANRLGYVSPQRKQWLEEVLERFESECEVQTNPLRHLDRMRAWLSSKMEAGELEIRNGRVYRSTCLTAFGLNGGSALVRFPEIKALFDEFDRRVRETCYLPKAMRDEQELVRSALRTVSPDVRRGLKVNLEAVAKECGFLPMRLKLPHLSSIVHERQQEFDGQIADNAAVSIVGGRIYDFSELSEAWSAQFVGRLAGAFTKCMSTLQAPPKDQFGQLVTFLRWISGRTSEDSAKVIAEARTKLKVLDGHAWENVVHRYRGHLIGEGRAAELPVTSVDQRIGNLRRALNALAVFGLVPEVRVPGIKHTRFLSRNLPTLVEPPLGAPKTDYLDFARRIFADACQSMSVDIDHGDAERFFNFLNEQVGIPHFGVNASTVVLNTLNNLLKAIERKAVESILSAMTDYDEGQVLLRSSTIKSEEFLEVYFHHKLSQPERRKLLRDFFPEVGGKLAPLGVANLLRLILDVFGGVCPVKPHPVYGQFFQKRYLECGGTARLDRMLGPDPETIGAIIALYQCESGINIAVARTLNKDCLEDSDLPGHMRVTGIKARAQGKPIVYDFRQSDMVVQAIEWLGNAGDQLRRSAGDDRERLFVTRIKTSPQMVTSFWYTDFFKRFTREFAGAGEHRLVPAMVRPSVLLSIALSNDGRLKAGLAIGQHTVGVSRGYQDKWPTRLIYDEHIRRAQSELEVVVLAAIPEAAVKLGISTEELRRRLDRLSPTGLGTFCLNIRGRPGQEKSVCATVDCWDNCPNMMVVAEAHSIAALQIWQTSLREVQGEWERDHIEKWEQVWLPWLCLADVVEERMTMDARLVSIWEEALSIAQMRASTPGFQPPRPY